ncbi:MAG: outermembrane protein [Nitrospira sp.]|nr:MAG: outermembrane protein [Nitrospira sp.]
MLRKLFVVLGAVMVASQAGLAMAANPDTGPGCGLGKLAWADFKNQKNIAPQVMMATTNGTFGSNTFGISSGTSGCTNDGQVWADQKTTMFALMNFENLTQEMAQGKGEHLASLASLMGIPDDRHAAFFALTQERYTALVQAGETSSVALVKALNDAVAKNPVLAQVVSR